MKRYRKVYVEITNVCNLKCDFCPSTNRALKYMNMKEFSHIANEIKPFTDYVYFHLMGEPLLNPALENFLLACDQKKLKANITTNGTLLEAKKQILINSSALRKISISLHSFEANKSSIGLQEYVSQVISFVKTAIKVKIICELRLWNEDSEAVRAGNKLNSDILNLLEQAFSPGFSLEAAIGANNNVKLAEYLFLQKAGKFDWPHIEKDIVDEDVFCYGLRDQFGILVDGTVVPCCLDNEGNIPLGNVFEQPLIEILNSDRAKRIYDGFTARIAAEALCKRCGYAKRHKRK